MSPADLDQPVLPATPREGFARVFAWYTRRLLSKKFFAVRITESGLETLRTFADNGPGVVIMNHASWWDPLIGFHLARTLTPNHAALAPMQLDQLKKFAFFRKVGVFGLDPDAPRALRAMSDYLRDRWNANPRTILWITPQGELTDVRASLKLRPGAAACAALRADVSCAALAIELGFWNEQRPELFLHAVPLSPERRSISSWNRAMTDSLAAAQRQLAQRVIARDGSAFVNLLGGASASINPIYNAWLRLRGKNVALDVRRDTSSERAR